MSTQIFSKKTMVLVMLVALVVSTQVVFAAGSEGRLETWVGSFQKLAEERPDLSDTQALSVLKAIDMATPAMFSDSLTEKQRAQIAERIEDVRGSLSCDDYNDLRDDLLVMKEWLESNSIVVAVGDCYCTKGVGDDGQVLAAVAGDGCAEGWECDNTIACTSREGTTHNGRCKRSN